MPMAISSAYDSRDEAAKNVDKKVIQVTTENYMEVMEVIYDYPDQFEPSVKPVCLQWP